MRADSRGLLWVLAGFAGALSVKRLRDRFLVVTVAGTSMVPTLNDGDRLLARRLSDTDEVRCGDLVVLSHDGQDMVKRVVALGGDIPPGGGEPLRADLVYVVGDQPGSIDSRAFGPLSRKDLSAVVIRPLIQ